MSATSLGKIKAPNRRYYEAKWDEHDRKLYVDGNLIGTATSLKEAIYKAQAWVMTNKT